MQELDHDKLLNQYLKLCDQPLQPWQKEVLRFVLEGPKEQIKRSMMAGSQSMGKSQSYFNFIRHMMDSEDSDTTERQSSAHLPKKHEPWRRNTTQTGASWVIVDEISTQEIATKYWGLTFPHLPISSFVGQREVNQSEVQLKLSVSLKNTTSLFSTSDQPTLQKQVPK